MGTGTGTGAVAEAEAEAEMEVPETMIQERIQFELNPTFSPPESASPEFLTKWQRMVPAEKRKLFILRQLDKYESITLVSAVCHPSQFHVHRFRLGLGLGLGNLRLGEIGILSEAKRS